jgi:hypothetical protein
MLKSLKPVSAGSMTPGKRFPRGNSIIIDFLGEYEAICETPLGRESGPLVGLIDNKKPEV